MPRNSETNAEVREARKRQILDAALTVYIRFGYHGTDMDSVAEEAQLAKGLLYYYYKTKKELFVELYTWMFNESFNFSADLLEKSEELNPIEQLMCYAYGVFGESKMNPRIMQFNMRVPFDAYAVFGPDGWKDGAQKSDVHRKALTKIIERGIEQGLIPNTNPISAANSFWSVFVGNVFDYSKLIMGGQLPNESEADVLRNVVNFCFQGLGIEYSVWNDCLDKTISQSHERGVINEDL